MHYSAPRVPGELRFEATDAVRDALARMGRTEDLRFSPNGERLAFACYSTDRVALADVQIDRSSDGPEIALTRLVYLESERFREPHGIDFVDDETLVVGNRAGQVEVFRLRDSGEIEAAGQAGDASGLIDSPGSIAVRALESGGHEVVACNNWANTVTRHPLVSHRSESSGEVIARRWLDLPDGVALSHNGRWLAVSNHAAHTVLVYEYPGAHQDNDPVGVLRGVTYPHGLRFANGDRHLLVADAGAPLVAAFTSSGDWKGARFPSAAMRVVDDATFVRGRKNQAEGGPKGLDVEGRSGVLAITLEEQSLAFFDLESVVDAGFPDEYDDALVEYELLGLVEAQARTDRAEANEARARAELADILESTVWRMTAPARRIRTALKARSHRSRA